MHTLRQTDGLSGFVKRAESEYDAFGAGHSSTSISAGLGGSSFRMAMFLDLHQTMCLPLAVYVNAASIIDIRFDFGNYPCN